MSTVQQEGFLDGKYWNLKKCSREIPGCSGCTLPCCLRRMHDAMMDDWSFQFLPCPAWFNLGSTWPRQGKKNKLSQCNCMRPEHPSLVLSLKGSEDRLTTLLRYCRYCCLSVNTGKARYSGHLKLRWNCIHHKLLQTDFWVSETRLLF